MLSHRNLIPLVNIWFGFTDSGKSEPAIVVRVSVRQSFRKSSNVRQEGHGQKYLNTKFSFQELDNLDQGLKGYSWQRSLCMKELDKRKKII